MVICFNFLFNLSLYCCCLAFLKTKLYLLKAKKKGWCVFLVLLLFLLMRLFIQPFFGGKLLLQMGVKTMCFGLKTSIFSLSKSKRTIIGSAVATCFFIFALYNYCVISFHFQSNKKKGDLIRPHTRQLPSEGTQVLGIKAGLLQSLRKKNDILQERIVTHQNLSQPALMSKKEFLVTNRHCIIINVIIIIIIIILGLIRFISLLLLKKLLLIHEKHPHYHLP